MVNNRAVRSNDGMTDFVGFGIYRRIGEMGGGEGSRMYNKTEKLTTTKRPEYSRTL